MSWVNLHRNLVVVLLILASLLPLSASTGHYFHVQFTDKNNSPFSLSMPSDFLSQRAIDRRATFRIAIDSLDLPVNPAYLNAIEALGVQVHSKSKWMNSVTVLVNDTALMTQVRSLPFVKQVQYTGKIEQTQAVKSTKVKAINTDLYGSAATQIHQISGGSLHARGYRGSGILIAVLDAGFMNVDVNRAFDSLRLQGRLLGTKDMIEPNSAFFAQDPHGANVLSIMTGNLAGQYLGTAPDASYWLIRTEYAPTEYLVEADFWVSGIGYADSVGADVVNSSLGYYLFDDAATNFSYDDMNGRVSRASIAATMAAKKGMVVVVSAGNEGNKSWRYISSPADAEGILTVGAVQTDSISSSFSSFGPSSDRRVKPEICALGTATALVNSLGNPVYGNGTSYASPVIAGFMACLLQRYKAESPNPTISVLLQSVISSASLYANPTSQMGYGIPDFSKAESFLSIYDSLQQTDDSDFRMAYNQQYKTMNISSKGGVDLSNALIHVYAVSGQKVLQQKMEHSTTIVYLDKLKAGIYCVLIWQNGALNTRKFLLY